MGVKVDYQNSIKNINDLDTIYITGGGYVNYPFKGISRDSAMGWEEPVWGAELTRSRDFVLSNIEDVDFGLVDRCEVSFKYMNIQDFMALRIIAKQRFCTVNFYSRDHGIRITREMAFTNNEIGKLYAFGTEYLGVLDVNIKLVGTGREKAGLINNIYTISYNNNGGSGTINNQSVSWSETIQLSNGASFSNSRKILLNFNTKADGTGRIYLPNQIITVFDDLTLYAQWKQMNADDYEKFMVKTADKLGYYEFGISPRSGEYQSFLVLKEDVLKRL